MGDTYAVKEVFHTLQGEGRRAGTAAVFIRFAGCNLWSGQEEGRDKGKGACAKWCDTDFVGGVKVTARDLVEQANNLWRGVGYRWVVLTGGEPMLQVDEELCVEFHTEGWSVAVESNGTVASEAYPCIDHLCVSPKKGGGDWLSLGVPDELKVVLGPESSSLVYDWTYDELRAMQTRLADESTWLYVQPQDGPRLARSVQRCVEWVKTNPAWMLSVQTHKTIGLP